MSDTPRTESEWNKLNRDDSTGYQVAVAMKIFAKQLERELAEARKQRDNLQRQNELVRNESLICADCDAIRKEEYDKAIEQRDALAKGFDAAQQAIVKAVKQRDTLAEALLELLCALGATSKPHELMGYGISKYRAQQIIALAAVKGGEQ